MADTGENRQITSRTNAKEAEAVRVTTKMVSKERSAEKATDSNFGAQKGINPRRSHPKTRKSRGR